MISPCVKDRRGFFIQTTYTECPVGCAGKRPRSLWHAGSFAYAHAVRYALPLPLQAGQGVLLPQCGQLTGVTLPLPRQRGQGLLPDSVLITPRPVQSGHMGRRWPFQQAPQEILPVPSHFSQSCMARSSQTGIRRLCKQTRTAFHKGLRPELPVPTASALQTLCRQSISATAQP